MRWGLGLVEKSLAITDDRSLLVSTPVSKSKTDNATTSTREISGSSVLFFQFAILIRSASTSDDFHRSATDRLNHAAKGDDAGEINRNFVQQL